ncbi:hypothetical protein G6O67_002182 [Ophiocordyceps sinensis]|uniref:Uncharacterized protein n=1 Tax=Ophiocordyceps sinensis TaxID=72228 RepID=A0A8H4PTR0_9HYPO|nr:hypothetical protein G6O67_002182 [Ophiocordyceps sinensis]
MRRELLALYYSRTCRGYLGTNVLSISGDPLRPAACPFAAVDLDAGYLSALSTRHPTSGALPVRQQPASPRHHPRTPAVFL